MLVFGTSYKSNMVLLNDWWDFIGKSLGDGENANKNKLEDKLETVK